MSYLDTSFLAAASSASFALSTWVCEDTSDSNWPARLKKHDLVLHIRVNQQMKTIPGIEVYF